MKAIQFISITSLLVPQFTAPAIIFLWVQFPGATAKEPECNVYNLEQPDDYRCETIACLNHWPSESQNYDGPNSDSDKYLTKRRVHARDFSDELMANFNSFNGDMTSPLSTTSIGKRDGTELRFVVPMNLTELGGPGTSSGSSTGDMILPRDTDVPQCCRPTWECWKFWDSNPDIKDLTVFKKWACCLLELTEQKPFCLEPPWLPGLQMKEPPLCSDSYE